MSLPSPAALRRLAPAPLALLLAACTSWRPARVSDDWTLYVRDGSSVELEAFEEALSPAFTAVEAYLGPFREHVRVHAWNGGVRMRSGNRGEIQEGAGEQVEEIPGIGPAQVRAFHSRSTGGLFSPTGVFVGVADAGTTVHELVHARLAEEPYVLPLWFEEGYAMLLGDGAVHHGVWVVDGLACWPWRELGEEELDDAELAELLKIRSSENHSVRENVLVHFVGWAVVFDLHRETGSLDWRALLARFQEAADPLAEARRRMDRTLDEATPVEWLQRLGHEHPAVRMAAAKGTWKLLSAQVAVELLRRLHEEEDPEVQAALAVNALAIAGQTRLSWRLRGWLWRSIFPVFRAVELEDPAEQQALRDLYRAYRRGDRRRDTQAALTALARFWEE